jgi:hypothetical protein
MRRDAALRYRLVAGWPICGGVTPPFFFSLCAAFGFFFSLLLRICGERRNSTALLRPLLIRFAKAHAATFALS